MKSQPKKSEEAIISLKNVCKSFPSEDGVTTNVLTDVSLEVRHGEIVALVWPSGCGKTTLLNLVSGIDTPTSGSVFVEGREISSMNDDARANYRSTRLAFVFQDFHLLPHLSVKENVSLLSEMFALPERMSVDEALSKVSLTHRVHTPVPMLSRGERQRVAIARAFLADTPIILADEPTGNLDSRNASAVMDLIESFARELGVTVLLITHDPAVAARADRVLDISNGKILNA